MTAPVFTLAEKITERMKELDREIAREHADAPDVARDLAAVHFGLGLRMLVECGWTPDEVVAMAEDLSHRVAADLPEVS